MASPRTISARLFSVAVAGTLLVALAADPAGANARQISIRTPSVTSTGPSPLLLLVSLKKQRVRVFDVNGEIASSRISSGMPGFDTPTGVFSILEKNQYHESNIYAGAPMPFMQRLTWSGIALHAGVVPGYRASHGCIRLPYSFARSLFGTSRVGNRVVVTGEETEPIAYDHPNLFKPLPESAPPAAIASTQSEAKVAANDQPGELGDVNRFLGVTPALARAVAERSPSEERRPATRAEAERMLSDKLVRLQASMKAADRARAAATEKAKTTVRDANDAREKLDAARRVIEPLRAAASAAQKRQQDAVSAFAAYMAAAYPSDGAPASADTSDDKELNLEDDVIDFTAEADAARASLARSELEFAAVQAAFASADAARNTAIEAVRKNQIDLRAAQAALIDANKETVRRIKPISVFISLRSQRMIVRQGFEPLFEMPITLNGPINRVGTHVFTAMRYAPEDPDRFEWHLVSAHTPSNGEFDMPSSKRKKNRREASPQSTASNLDMATNALDLIAIPSEARTTIAELVRPGASLIVSDRDLSPSENGRGTEFVLLTR